RIAAYQDTLPEGKIINGWLHSHGELEFRHFSAVDDLNQATVLDYVTSLLMLPVSQKEVVIRDLALKVMGEGEGEVLDAHAPAISSSGEKAAPGAAPASVTLYTDVPVSRARLLETVYGGFCFAIVIGDEGWTRQEIHYKTRGILTGETLVSRRQADLVPVTTGKLITALDQEALEEEVKDRIRPTTYKPENIERM
ncbi:MAG: hypothetical protein WAU47_15330, partial [Desulfobaccales bacterium]